MTLRLAPEVLAARKLRCCDIKIKNVQAGHSGTGELFYHAGVRKQTLSQIVHKGLASAGWTLFIYSLLFGLWLVWPGILDEKQN